MTYDLICFFWRAFFVGSRGSEKWSQKSGVKKVGVKKVVPLNPQISVNIVMSFPFRDLVNCNRDAVNLTIVQTMQSASTSLDASLQATDIAQSW